MIQVLICIVTFSVIYLTVDKPVKYILMAKAGLQIIIKTVHQCNWIKKKVPILQHLHLGKLYKTERQYCSLFIVTSDYRDLPHVLTHAPEVRRVSRLKRRNNVGKLCVNLKMTQSTFVVRQNKFSLNKCVICAEYLIPNDEIKNDYLYKMNEWMEWARELQRILPRSKISTALEMEHVYQHHFTPTSCLAEEQINAMTNYLTNCLCCWFPFNFLRTHCTLGMIRVNFYLIWLLQYKSAVNQFNSKPRRAIIHKHM